MPERDTTSLVARRSSQLDFGKEGFAGRVGHQIGQPSSLSPGLIEVRGLEPRFHGLANRRPLFDRDRVPGSVPIATFRDDVISEEAA